MKKHDLSLSLLMVLTLITGCSTDGVAPQASGDNDDVPAAEPAYAVADYDAGRDPKKDLTTTIRQASSDGKRILLEVGGNW